MKQTNNKEEQAKFENPVFEQILKIIKSTITVGEMQALEKKYGFNKTILKIIESDKTNKQLALFLISEIGPEYFRQFTDLHDDKTIVRIAILKDSSNYFFVSKELMLNIEIGEIVIESMVREGKNYFEVEGFIEKYFQKNKKRLYKKYKEVLELSAYIYSSDINKQILLLKDSNKNLYDLVIKLGLLTKNTGKIELNKKFVTNIIYELSKNKDYIKLDKKEQHNFNVNHIEKIFGIKFNKLKPEEKFIFDSLLNLLQIVEANLKLNTKVDNDEKDISEKKEKKQLNDDSGNYESIYNNTKNEDDFSQMLFYSYPDSSLSKVSGGYNIETITGKHIFINTNDKDKFTSKSLTNYIKFYNTIYNLGLSFLWNKYFREFKILCNNKFGFDYTSGEGITESKTLSVLNMIGKNIGVPEYEVEVNTYSENNDGNEDNTSKISPLVEKRLTCFKTIGDAKILFMEIKETGYINEKKYSDNSVFGNGAVENKLIEVLCIDQKGNGLNISKWK